MKYVLNYKKEDSKYGENVGEIIVIYS